MTLKFTILYDFVDGPYGGGNQFLHALRNYARNAGAYTDDPLQADVALFNSHHSLDRVFALKRRRPNLRLVHRVDGPILAVRGNGAWIDRSISAFNDLFADGTVFQSDWSRNACMAGGMKATVPNATITNAPDPVIFNAEGRQPATDPRLRIIATSWSPNVRKGFDVYRYLDEHLDFSRYAMTFLGNAPVTFRNIRQMAPVPSAEVAALLKRHDLFVTASENDPCSNSLIEALHCGLPTIALRSGGHPEIVGDGGALFDDVTEVLPAIDRVAAGLDAYRTHIDVPSIGQVGEAYVDFMRTLIEGGGTPRRVTPATAIAYQRLAMEGRLRGALAHAKGRLARVRRARR